jgi:hypothetical protein
MMRKMTAMPIAATSRAIGMIASWTRASRAEIIPVQV